MTEPRSGRPGAAALALLVILAITAGWWALALWPAGPVPPEWLVRTRAACFGSVRGGLPDVGGWILLIGQPLGMVGFLLAVWGDALRADLGRMRTDRGWRLAGLGLAAAALVGVVTVVRRVGTAAAIESAQRTISPGIPTRIDVDPPPIALIDQYGRRAALAEFSGHPTLLGFAYGHCRTVCPLLVHDLRAARAETNRPEVPILIITLDPWRDTPDRLSSLASQWRMEGEDRVLSGSITEVEATLNRLGIGRRRDGITGDIDHVGTVMLLDERGRIAWRLDGGWGGVRALLAPGRGD
ncbi:MAG TPA: SCO family protein [Gemmatimonadales bacterium]|nr:SCO family protein [Gemmatimonadales bacterium]